MTTNDVAGLTALKTELDSKLALVSKQFSDAEEASTIK